MTMYDHPGDRTGDQFTLWVNQGEREAVCLYSDADDVVIEYTMPAGTSALRHWRQGRGWRLAQYERLPRYLLAKLADDGVTWEGRPQQRRRGYTVRQPEELLKGAAR